MTNETERAIQVAAQQLAGQVVTIIRKDVLEQFRAVLGGWKESASERPVRSVKPAQRRRPRSDVSSGVDYLIGQLRLEGSLLAAQVTAMFPERSLRQQVRVEALRKGLLRTTGSRRGMTYWVTTKGKGWSR